MSPDITNPSDRYKISSPHTKIEALTKLSDPIATRSAAMDEWLGDAELCIDLWGGTRSMRAAGEKRLPRFEGEDYDEEYKRRLNQAVLTPFFRDAVESLVGQAFQRPLDWKRPEGMGEEDAERLAGVVANVDRRSSAATDFGRNACENSLGFGFTAILVDFPVNPGTGEKSEAEAPKLWPRWREIGPWNILEAVEEEDQKTGEPRLAELRYYDPVTRRKDEWENETVERIVVLRRAGRRVEGVAASQTSTMQVYVREENGDKFMPQPPRSFEGRLTERFREIPLVYLPSGRSGFFHSLPKLRELAEHNALHFVKRSTFDTAVEVASAPMHLFTGMTDDDLKDYQRGPYRYLATGNTEAKAHDLSFRFEGSAKISLEDMTKLERYMAWLAREPFLGRASGEIKATERLLDEAKRISRLQAWALQWLGALQECLDWSAAWLGFEEAGELAYDPEVFDSLQAQPDARLLLDARLAGVPIPDEVILSELQRHGHLSDTWDVKQIAEEGETGGPIE